MTGTTSAPAPSGRATPHSYIKLNERDLVDYRAIQRTFDGAYARTAMGQLCYAIVILRLFQDRFFYVGMVYAILAVGFIPVAIVRYRMAVQNEDRYFELKPSATGSAQSNQGPGETLTRVQTGQSTEPANDAARPTMPVRPVSSVLRKTFVTAGSVVAAATTFVALTEIALLVLILRI
ncbi:hypothetical protein BCV70DRAFT_48308 [Testicularia cyperi]|uniref:DUF202 domain-containing protein n=1 Tax=Testicularia cyperi TaxID=1882483 RepID=A0A317XK06_9BASI|nr:hypothetical protein BCV70DRAFT_48308 [Testicularia cyperi]